MNEQVRRSETMDVNLMTETTYKRLQGRLESLKEDLARAKLRVGEAAGPSYDWHDNFPFEEARRDVEMYTTQVRDLAIKLRQPQIIKPNQETKEVQIGNSVVLKFADESEPSTFTILGPDDTNKEKGWISYTAPVVQAIIGKKAGEEVVIKRPSDTINLKITEILPGQFE